MRHEVHYWSIKAYGGSYPFVLLFDSNKFVTYVRSDDVTAGEIDIRPPALGRAGKRWLMRGRSAVCLSYLLFLAWDELL